MKKRAGVRRSALAPAETIQKYLISTTSRFYGAFQAMAQAAFTKSPYAPVR
jgi:hypothetical protein